MKNDRCHDTFLNLKRPTKGIHANFPAPRGDFPTPRGALKTPTKFKFPINTMKFTRKIDALLAAFLI